MKRVFLDLDGVMADFDGDFERRMGVSPEVFCEAHNDEVMWEWINGFDNFFLNLPPCKGAMVAWRHLRGYQPFILTACPKSNYKGVADQKHGWVRKHLGPCVTVLPTCGGSSKPRFMQQPGDILIDDFERNTKAWEKAGGIAILHTGDWDATLDRLDELMSNQNEPAWL